MTTEQHKKSPEEFAKEHWPLIFTGALASAAILLLVKYYRHINQEKVNETDLDLIETEALTEVDDTAMLLETGLLAATVIPESENLTRRLAAGLSGKAKEVMETLGQLKRKRK